MLRQSSLLGALFLTACTALNPSYGDAGSTSGAGTGSDIESSTAAGTTSHGEGSGSTGAGSSGEATADSSSGSSGGGSESSSGGPTLACVLEPKTECNLHGDQPFCPLEEESCVPWAPEPDGEVVTTYCFPWGNQALGGDCAAACLGEPDKTCGPELLCDMLEGEAFGTCREPCGGTFEAPNCSTGLCYQFLPVGWQYGICRGDCNPTGPGPSCDGEAFCAVSSDGRAPMCVVEDAPGALGETCEMRACAEGLICVQADLLVGCEAGRCCAELCDPPEGTCEGGGECTQVPDDFGLVDLGYCPL